MVHIAAMKRCAVNVSLSLGLARHVQSQLGGELCNASESVRDVLRRDRLSKQHASLALLRKRDLAQIAAQTEDDLVFAQMARHSAAMSKSARS
jgi:hypothetical protein